MKTFLKKVYFNVEGFFFKIFLIKKEFRFIGMKNYIIYFLFQRIFRINSSVPWPVHWSSVVVGSSNIKYKNEITPLGYSGGSYIQANNGINVGTNVIHAVGLTIITANHELHDFTLHTVHKPVVIGDNCWLGANVTLLPGVELGNHVIVAAGSVVTKSFLESDTVIGGIPARVMKKIEPYNGQHYFLDNKCVVNNTVMYKSEKHVNE